MVTINQMYGVPDVEERSSVWTDGIKPTGTACIELHCISDAGEGCRCDSYRISYIRSLAKWQSKRTSSLWQAGRPAFLRHGSTPLYQSVPSICHRGMQD